jgi:hypothetical protein
MAGMWHDRKSWASSAWPLNEFDDPRVGLRVLLDVALSGVEVAVSGDGKMIWDTTSAIRAVLMSLFCTRQDDRLS